MDKCVHEMTCRIEPCYAYVECGMSGVFLQNIEIYTCTNCGEEEVALPKIAQLHESLALSVCSRPAHLYGDRIKFLRKHIGWSSDKFAEIFGVDHATVRRWESGIEWLPEALDLALRLYVIQGVRDEHYELDS